MAEWDYKLFWDETMNQLRKEVGEEEFAIWLSNVGYIGAAETEITAAVPSAFFQGQFGPKYLSRLEAKMRELTGKTLTISLQVVPRNGETAAGKTETPAPGGREQPKSASPAAKAQTAAKKQLPQLREEFTFEHFIIGENNSFAANAAKAISNNPGNAYNPFLIYGGVGLGKTHLMQAIGNHIHGASDDRVTYITAENFLNEFVNSLGKGMNAFKNKFRYTTDVLLMDDIQFFQGKEAIQEELYHTFNTLLDSKKQVAFTCDRPVSELKKIPERLLSRFESALKVDLQPPKYETRYAILRSINKAKNAQIPEEIIDLVSKNVSSNVRDLISSFNNLVAVQELTKTPITLEFAQRHLSFSSTKQTNLSIDTILKTVAEEYNLSPKDLKNRKRSQNIVTPRHIAMYLVREITEYSTTEIGQEFGRDHSTVITTCRKIEAKIQSDPNFYSVIENLKRKVREFNIKS
jgi:chromosomal replication initiator protein